MKNSLISIDYGTRKSGLAYSVESFCFAYKTIPTHELLEKVPKWAMERKAESIVVGMPYNIDGSMSRHGKRVLEFVRRLKAVTPLPIILHDERLSTSEALLGFDEDGITDGDIDAEAARLILMDFLSHK